MNSFRLLDRRNGYLVAAFALVLSAIVPAIAAATAQLTERSIELSSSSASAKNVTYQVKFKAATDAAAFVIDFCSNTPLYGEVCDTDDAPDFTVASATTSTPGFTRSVVDANTIRVTGDITANSDIAVELKGIDNPSEDGTLYARIVTFDTDAHAQSYAAQGPNEGATDNGSVAIAITPTVGVAGSVLEAMTFCVSKAVPGDSCASATDPVLELGEQSGDVVALQPGVVSTGNLYTQISTNAVSGAVISLKSNTPNCGGLLRAGAPSACDIAPALENDVDGSAARFGVRTGTVTGVGANPNGTLRPFENGTDPAYYSNTVYKLNYIAGNLTGVTSPYGDPFLDTNNAPVNNQNMELTFAATITNSTPAGRYAADLSMIATGKF